MTLSVAYPRGEAREVQDAVSRIARCFVVAGSLMVILQGQPRVPAVDEEVLGIQLRRPRL